MAGSSSAPNAAAKASEEEAATADVADDHDHSADGEGGGEAASGTEATSGFDAANDDGPADAGEAPVTGGPSEAGASLLTAAFPLPRKFLCNAPRPEHWEACGDSVLERLGSSKNAAAVLSGAISKIRSLHRIHPKVGPGRKSNAVHALLFYEYLADRARSGGGHRPLSSFSRAEDGEAGAAEDNSEEDDAGDDGSFKYGKEPAGARGRAAPPASEPEPEVVDSEVAEGAMELLSDDEFIREHRTICEVCECGAFPDADDDDWGPLLLCSTCACAFHVPCSRPALGGPPREDQQWRCSYCVLASEPKYTKPRRIAAAAVRLMARLRNQHRRRGRSDAGATESSQGHSGIILRRGRRAAEAVPATPQRPEKSPADRGDSDRRRADTSRGRASRAKETQSGPTSGLSPGRERRSSLKASAGDGTAAVDDSGSKNSHASTTNAAEGNEDDEKVPGTPTSAGSGSPRRRSLELYRIANKWSPQDPSAADESESPRGKRLRKQPVMYDPQAVPAGKWKSDEVPPPPPRSSGSTSGGGSSSDQDDMDGKPGSGTNSTGAAEPADDRASDAASDVRPGRGDAVWCNFCFDDPGIKVCCFCACRVCFGKKSRNKLLICDMCHDEYHTYCLDPPLERVPAEEKWFCPSCAEANAKRAGRASSRLRVPVNATEKDGDEASTPRRASARAPAPKKESDASSSVASNSRGSASGAIGNPRGRPRKSPPPDSTALSSGKRRGRPPRSPTVEPPRKRGRPPKSRSQSSPGRGASKSPSSPRRGGSKSPSSSDTTESKSNAVEGPSLDERVDISSTPSTPEGAQLPVTVSRSGRTVKRSSFHDEKNEGDQHLRGGRQPVELPRKASISDPFSLELPAEEAVTSVPGLDSVPAVGLAASDAATFAVPPEIPRLAGHAAPVPAPTAADSAEISAASAAVAGTASATDLLQEDLEMDQDGPKDSRTPRRKPGARECMQMSRRFGAQVIPEQSMEILVDYCKRGKCEHLIRMRERLDEHCRFLEAQLAGLEALALEQSAGSQGQAQPDRTDAQSKP